MTTGPADLVSVYSGRKIVLTSKHHKSRAIAPAMQQRLGAQVVECGLDTDQLGTFSGEVERPGKALTVVKRKCEWGMRETSLPLGMASEGSFGPHPMMPFLAMGQELLFFIDQINNFETFQSLSSENTNYKTETLASIEGLEKFAQQVRFPSHAIILRSTNNSSSTPLFKGIVDKDTLQQAFIECQGQSEDGKVWAETDMRAHLNPTRMSVIAELAGKLADRLAFPCPACELPGWGVVDSVKGLPCTWCGSATELVKTLTFGCVRCDHRREEPRPDGLTEAEPGRCPQCNP